LFTIDEETGMTGSFEFKRYSSRTGPNLDTEEDDSDFDN
jgi:hypothetical protein